MCIYFVHVIEYKLLFAKFDHDDSKSIDTSELGDALRYLGCNPLDAEVEEMVAEANGKGKSPCRYILTTSFRSFQPRRYTINRA